MCNLPTLSDRRAYIMGVREKRGIEAAAQLERDVRNEWVKIVALRGPKKQSALKPAKKRAKKPATI